MKKNIKKIYSENKSTNSKLISLHTEINEIIEKYHQYEYTNEVADQLWTELRPLFTNVKQINSDDPRRNDLINAGINIHNKIINKKKENNKEAERQKMILVKQKFDEEIDKFASEVMGVINASQSTSKLLAVGNEMIEKYNYYVERMKKYKTQSCYTLYTNIYFLIEKMKSKI